LDLDGRETLHSILGMNDDGDGVEGADMLANLEGKLRRQRPLERLDAAGAHEQIGGAVEERGERNPGLVRYPGNVQIGMPARDRFRESGEAF
jgi:hypothetical protein